MQRELNDEIAGFFMNDSRLFLDRYTQLQNKQTEIGNRSKLMIDLIFSMECSLKAILFYQSAEDEKKTYKKMRIHDLNKLLGFIADKNHIQQAAETIAENIDHLNVTSRYTLEANIHFRGPAGDLGPTYYNTIANPAWLENLYKSAKSLYDYGRSLKAVEIKTFNFQDIDVAHELEKTERIKALATVR